MVYLSQSKNTSFPLSPPDRLPLIRGALLVGVLAIAGVGGGVAPPDLLLSQEQRTAYQQLMAEPSQQPPGMALLITHVQAMSSLIAFFRFAASGSAAWLAYRLLVRSVQLEEEEADYQQQRALLSQANAQQLAASKQQELLLMQGELAGNAQFVEEVLAPATAEQRARAYYAAQHGLSIEEYEAILAEEQANQEALEVEAQRVAVALERQAQVQQSQSIPTETPALEAKTEAVNSFPTPAQPEGFFDWNDLKDADQHPVLGVVGPMGSGKTRVAKWLSRHVIGASLKVFDMYAAEGDWGNAEVHSDFELMAVEMAKDVDLIKNLVNQYRQGKRDFSPAICIMEEAAATTTVLRNANKKLYDVWNLYYRTVTRKIKRRIMTLSVELNAQVFGTSAESRDCATIIFPGKPGVAKALEDTDYFGLGAKPNIELRDSLEQQLKNIDRPALVYVRGQWFPASIPSLSEQGDVVS